MTYNPERRFDCQLPVVFGCMITCNPRNHRAWGLDNMRSDPHTTEAPGSEPHQDHSTRKCAVTSSVINPQNQRYIMIYHIFTKPSCLLAQVINIYHTKMIYIPYIVYV